MKRKTNNKSDKLGYSGIKNMILTIFLAVVVLIGNSYLWSVKADTTTDPNTASPAATTTPQIPNGLTTCPAEIGDFASQEFDKYKIWMEQNFSNKSSTSSLLELGRQRYHQFVDTLQNKNQEILNAQIGATNAQVADQGAAFTACQNIVDDYVGRAEQLLTLRVESTSAIKRTSVFIEKYEEINSKLRTMNLDILKLSVNLQSFDQKLPCYLRQCI